MSASQSAAEVLRNARNKAGLTQVQVAQRAGVAQSVVSAYESGRRQPSLETLASLVEAAGFDLALTLRRSDSAHSQLIGPIGGRVRRHRQHLVAAAAAHGVTSLSVFGSVARGEDRPDSDVDLLADIPVSVGLFELGILTSELESILGSPVDLIPRQGLKRSLREHVERESIPL